MYLRTGKRTALACAVTAGLCLVALSACGGGGGSGNVRSESPPPPTVPPPPPPVSPPPPPPVSPPPISPPPPPPPPPPVLPPPPPPIKRADPVVNPAIDAHLTINGARAAAATGAGGSWTIGMIDTGIDTATFSPEGWTSASQYTAAPDDKDTTVGDKSGHGTQVARIILGDAHNGHPGGVYPQGRLLSARFLDDGHAMRGFSADGSFAATAQWLVDRGAGVVNVSTDKLHWSDEAGRQELYRGFANLARNGSLVVVAAGDEAARQPSALARLPWAADDPESLRDSWLVVGAVSSEQYDLISSYSNACGVALSVCLMAPGDVKTVTPGVTGLVDGHSTGFAAAQVSAAAAKVHNMYGYVDGELTRQILLGTAIDLGVAGVDDVYGYGLLSIDRALRGPARFDWGDVNIDPSLHNGGFAGEWSNDISGDGGLVIEGEAGVALYGGSGRRLLWLSGHNTYIGDTVIRDGHTLAIFDHQAGDFVIESASLTAMAGSHFGGDIQLKDGSLGLGLWGTTWPTVTGDSVAIDGSLFNNGVVSMPYNASVAWAPRDMRVSIGGDYTQTADAALGVHLGAIPLKVGGTASLDGELRILGTWSDYVFHTRAEVLEAARVEGAFDSVTWTWPTYLVKVTPHYDADRVWLELERANVVTTATALGFTPAAISGATLLEGAFGGLDRDPDGTLTDRGLRAAAAALQGASKPEQLERSLQTLSGEIYPKGTAFALITTEASRHALEERLDDAGHAQHPTSWVQAYRQQAGGGGMGLRADGWTTGTDVTHGALTLGVSLTSSQGGAWHTTRNDRDDTRMLAGEWFANLALGDGAYLLASMGYSHGQRRLQREIDLVATRHVVGSEQAVMHGNASLQGGVRLRWGRSQLTPYAGVQGLHQRMDGFHETGAAGFALVAEPSYTAVALGLAGVRWRHALQPGGGNWDLTARLEWQSVLSQRGRMRATFAGIDDAWVSLANSSLATDLGVLELGTQRRIGRGSQIGFTLGARESAEEHSGTASFEWSTSF